MAVNSILNNSAAASALLGFNKTQSELANVQDRLTTGMKVASAKDNASTFAIAFGLRSDVGTFKAVKENLATGGQIVNSSLNVTNQIGSQIQKLKEKLTQAKDQPQGRELIQQDIENYISQVKNWTQSATFNGINLLDGKGADAGQKFSVTGSLDRNSSGDPTLNSLSFDYQDLSIDKAGKGLGALLGMNVVSGVATETKKAAAAGLYSATLTDSATRAELSFAADVSGGTMDISTITGISFDAVDSGGSVVSYTIDISAAGLASTADLSADLSTLASTMNARMKETYGDNTGFEFVADAANDALLIRDSKGGRDLENAAFTGAGANTGFTVASDDAAAAETAFSVGDEMTFSYKDSSGANKSITMTAVANGAPANEFQFELGAANARGATLTNLATKLQALTSDGGILANSGITFAATANDISVTRDNVGSSVQILGLSTKDSKTGTAVGMTSAASQQTSAKTSQVSLNFAENTGLKAGDQISMAFDNNGTEEKISFRIGAADQVVQNGAKVDGADNTYWLNYRDVVGSDSDKRSGSQVAELLKFALTNNNTTAASDTGASVAGLSFRLYGGVVANDTPTVANSNARDRFDSLTNGLASLSWDGKGGLTLTDTAQNAADTFGLKSFNVNGNSNGVDFASMMKAADQAEQVVKKVMGSLGSASQRLTSQSEFVDTMIKTLNENVSTLVDADMAEEAARLQALQTKSQLGIQALSTANQSTQGILSLFR